MFHHVGEWSRVVARDYRHHPLVSIFTSALMIPLSLTALHCIVTLCKVIGLAGPPPPASSHCAPFMISFSFHAATEHSEFDSLVMYARRKIVSHVFFFTTGYLDARSPFLAENGARRYGVPDTDREYPDTLSLFTSSCRRTHEDHLYR